MDLASGKNIKKLPFVSHGTIIKYLQAASSFALDKLQPDPCYRHSLTGIQLGRRRFPALNNWLKFLKKWDTGSNKAWSLDLPILRAIEEIIKSEPFLGVRSCAADAIILGCHTGSRSCEYCRGTTRGSEKFAVVPDNRFTREWAGYPIALVRQDVAFLDEAHRILEDTASPHTSATYVQITFRFDKGGGRNFNCRTFKRMSSPFLCPVLAMCRIIERWRVLGGDLKYPLCCFYHSKTASEVLSAGHVSALIHCGVCRAYPDETHIFRRNIHLFRTHSLRVFACCALLACGVREETIEHKLRWASSAWKGYIRESLHEVDKTALLLFREAQVDQSSDIVE